MCLDNPRDLVIQGPFLTQYEKLFSIYVTRCSNRDTCETKEEIDKFINDHYVTIIRNDQKYDS